MDMLKQVILAGKYKAEARLANLAAKEMAKHCDKRIAAALKALETIAAFNVTPSTGASVAMRMRDLAKDALAVTSQERG